MTPERHKKLTNVLTHRQPSLVVVMENVHDPHNIMAVARSCDAIGIQTIYTIGMVDGEEFNIKQKGGRSSSSANKWVDFKHFETVEDCYAALRSAGFTILCTHLDAKGEELCEIDFTKQVALVFGNEKDGITEEALRRADGNFVIEQVGMIQSLNISVACAVTLYEAFRQRRKAGFYQHQQLSETEYKAIFERWSKKPPKQT